MTTVIFYYPIGQEKRVLVHQEEVDYNPEVGVAVFPHSQDLHQEYEILYRIYAVEQKGKKRIALAEPATEDNPGMFSDGRRDVYDILLGVYANSLLKVVSEIPMTPKNIGFNKAFEIVEEAKLTGKISRRVIKELQKAWSRENDS